ncbi:MAG TPA: hypothetical protein VNW29_01745 [Candidatus Sulfotelmatobacter sp.]|jgi:hypothetical protein|nr:hypothetical protein [Candidatus Sulfotelmatobacter sp.]
MKRQTLPKKKTTKLIKKNRLFKGGIDAGTVYGVLLLAILLGGAYMMLGNIAPNIASPDQNQPVILQKPVDQSNHSDLQLKNLTGITLTPTPSPSPTPTPVPTSPPPGPGGGAPGGGGNGPGSGGGPPGAM